MKRIAPILISLIILAVAVPASAQKRTWGAAAGALHGDFFAQLRKDVWLGGDLSAITVQGGINFRSKTTFVFDADYHFNLKSGNGRFYPLAGVEFAFNSDNAKFMVNGGGGLNFKLTEKLAAFGEVKYIFGSWDGWGLMGGIYF